MIVHHQEELAVAFDDVVNREHVRVRDLANHVDLAPEALDDRSALARVGMKNLQRDLRARLFVVRASRSGRPDVSATTVAA